MMDDKAANPNADSDTLVLEGFQWLKSCGDSLLSHSSLYLEIAPHRLVLVEQIAAQISTIVGFDDRFHDRLELLETCVHPSLTQLEPGGYTCGGRYYLIKENVEGQTLRQWMQGGEITPAKAQHIILSVASALDVMHRQGAVHGAVNADQVWIDRNDAVKLELCPASTFLEPGELVNLLGLDVVHTMPPEFTSGEPPRPQSDLFQLAALYYELLSGDAPRGVITRLTSSLQIDIRVSSIILKALSPNPEERQASIEEFCAPLLGHTPVGATMGAPIPQAPRPASKLLIVVTIVIGLAASVGTFFGWKWYQKRKQQSVPVAVVEEEQPVMPVTAPSGIVTPRCGWVGIQGDANQAVMEFELLNVDELQHLLKPIADPDHESVFTPPQLTRYRFEDETGKALTEARPLDSTGRPVFSLSLKLNEPTPQGICLVLLRVDGQFALKSNIVTVSDALAEHRKAYATREEPPKEPPTEETMPDQPGKAIPPLYTNPAASSSVGDYYIYAAHLYLGNEVSLLKLEFGNAGKVMLTMSDLTFQCAFSIDDTLDTLLEATPDALPTHAKDLAAGGFNSKWLGLDGVTLAAGKKIWTKQTFRIDTSNPELIKTAKYLLVRINHRQTSAESNYENNLIVIPLDHPNQWHSFTQDMKDTVTTGETDPAAQKAPGAP
jgi:serine/threonine protein kinase